MNQESTLIDGTRLTVMNQDDYCQSVYLNK